MDLQNAHIFPSVSLPIEVLSTLNILSVDIYTMKDAQEDSPMGRRLRAYLEDQRFQGSMEDWVQIGEIDENQSYFCDIENKWEYVYRNDALFVRKEELETAKERWRHQESQGLHHNPFQALASLR